MIMMDKKMDLGSWQLTSSVETATKRRIPPYTWQASRSTCVPYVLFMVKARLLPKELSTWVCTMDNGGGSYAGPL